MLILLTWFLSQGSSSWTLAPLSVKIRYVLSLRAKDSESLYFQKEVYQKKKTKTWSFFKDALSWIVCKTLEESKQNKKWYHQGVPAMRFKAHFWLAANYRLPHSKACMQFVRFLSEACSNCLWDVWQERWKQQMGSEHCFTNPPKCTYGRKESEIMLIKNYIL